MADEAAITSTSAKTMAAGLARTSTPGQHLAAHIDTSQLLPALKEQRA